MQVDLSFAVSLGSYVSGLGIVIYMLKDIRLRLDKINGKIAEHEKEFDKVKEDKLKHIEKYHMEVTT
jgi:hypothetical protein